MSSLETEHIDKLLNNLGYTKVAWYILTYFYVFMQFGYTHYYYGVIKVINQAHSSKLNSVIEAMHSIGLCINHNKLSQSQRNKIYRIGTTDKPKGRDGWYKIMYDSFTEFVTVIFGNWATQHQDKYSINLKANTKRIFTPLERKKYAEHVNVSIKAQHEADELQKEANRIALVKIYQTFKTCYSHNYLTRKCVEDVHLYNLRTTTQGQLAIPFYLDGMMHGYQTITNDGTKRFNGSVGSCYWQYPMNNPNPEVFNKSNSFYIIGEGLATCLSAYETISNHYDAHLFLPLVLCGFNANNLTKVVQATKHHKLSYLLLVDNDYTKSTNTGIETAKKIIKDHPDAVIYPLLFPNGDSNDYLIEYGTDEFIKLFNRSHNPLNNLYTYLQTNEVN